MVKEIHIYIYQVIVLAMFLGTPHGSVQGLNIEIKFKGNIYMDNVTLICFFNG